MDDFETKQELMEELRKRDNIISEMSQRLRNVEEVLEEHGHTGLDGSSALAESVNLKPTSFITIGNSQHAHETLNEGESNEVNRNNKTAGKGQSDEFTDTSVNSQINLEHQPGTTGGVNFTFYYGFRPPLYLGTGSFSSGGTTLTDSLQGWSTNELAGAWLNVYDGATLYTYTIASNTETVITINETFDFTGSGASYVVWVPIYLGAADWPWRRVYTATDIRFGIGASNGNDVCYIKHGTGTPESNVTAQVGSLFLRLDGGSGTTLYVKESGTGNTGWSAV